LNAVENAILINRLIESKRVEREIQIARDIQLSLLPQSVPQLDNFEISVLYRPISDVGGDYYDILKLRKGALPVLIADVEGKGLSAALLAASSQAIVHSLNELYFFEPGKFISKANALIHDFTKGQRLITLFWMLVEDKKKSITYVNAGHIPPILIYKNKDGFTRLTTGGFIFGFLEDAKYETETIELESGDILAVFTDGVPEVANRDDEFFGEEAVADFLKKHNHLSADQLAEKLFTEIERFSEGKNFRDDGTLIILKAK
jgi:sigma-B regulation protein RsbU (phosphoserine phosphatase)